MRGAWSLREGGDRWIRRSALKSLAFVPAADAMGGDGIRLAVIPSFSDWHAVSMSARPDSVRATDHRQASAAELWPEQVGIARRNLSCVVQSPAARVSQLRWPAGSACCGLRRRRPCMFGPGAGGL